MFQCFTNISNLFYKDEEPISVNGNIADNSTTYFVDMWSRSLSINGLLAVATPIWPGKRTYT